MRKNVRHPMLQVLAALVIGLIASYGKAYAAFPAPKPPALSASAAILVDGQTGQILYGRQILKEYYPASITKIMTAYLAIKHGWTKTVHVSAAAQNQPGASCYLRAGETDPMPKVVTAMMLVSGNDAAWAVAQTVSGHVKNFVGLMNRTAKDWHAPNVHFQNPNGLPNPHHVVSALGMAIITEHAMKNGTFRKIVRTKMSTLPPDPSPRVYFNQNRLLYTYPGAVGVKIGYTVQADETIVAAARRDGILLIEVLLHDTPAGLWPDAKTLLNWGFHHFTQTTVVQGRQSLGHMVIDGRNIPVISARPLTYLVPSGTKPTVTWNLQPLKSLGNGLIKQGDVLGTAHIKVDGHWAGQVPVLSSSTVQPLPPVIHWRWSWLIAPSAFWALVLRKPRRLRSGYRIPGYPREDQ